MFTHTRHWDLCVLASERWNPYAVPCVCRVFNRATEMVWRQDSVWEIANAISIN